MSSILAKGQNVSLPDDVVRLDVVLGWTETEIEVDASALLLRADGKVASDDDFVFYNQPESPDGSVRFLGTSATEEGAQARIAIDLSSVPDTVHTVALAGSVGSGTFGQLGKLAFRVVDGAGQSLAEYVTADATSESAFVFGEVYRRGGVWKVRAVGQGWESGLAGLAMDFGVDVDDDAEPDQVDRPLGDALEQEPQRAVPVAMSPAGATAPEETGRRTRTDTPATPTKGVRTAKRVAKKAKPMEFKLAEHEAWQPARLFSVFGVGAGEEQERRATSALIATMQAVRPFARALCARMGAPTGAFEGYVEVQYQRGESTVIPDAVLKVVRGSRLWTGLLEVKTGNGKLRREQLESYLEVARKNKYDVVVSLSNDVPAGPGELRSTTNSADRPRFRRATEASALRASPPPTTGAAAPPSRVCGDRPGPESCATSAIPGPGRTSSSTWAATGLPSVTRWWQAPSGPATRRCSPSRTPGCRCRGTSRCD